ncbi:MAG: hypothetical protein NVV66_18460 [Cellulomonas sp.]|uniref:hypothetical protein n=1 Tax=Cellulomonas sp. TaxID=40001 RepID=UPI002582B314|nr:hypothetical protein [Cellulomonas sp.]MCR6706581.1 hypothetical protein [Cellulomonas sp.]
MSTRPLSTVLQDAAERVLDFDGPAVPLNLDALINALEHASALAAEHEYAAAHGVVRSDFGHDGAPAYPPLVALLGQVAVAPEPLVAPQLAPDEPEKPWLRSDVVACWVCPCGARGWLTRGASDEDRGAYDESVEAHNELCTAVPA